MQCQCPVCDGSARDRTPPAFHGIVVSCATCGNYDIADEYLDKLRALEPPVMFFGLSRISLGGSNFMHIARIELVAFTSPRTALLNRPSNIASWRLT